MRELLGDKDNRRLHLVESIYLKPGIEIDLLANTLDFSVMQTQLDIAFLNELIAPLSIEVSKDRRCTLNIPESLSTRVIYSRVLASNINFKVLEALYLNNYETYDQIAESLYISVATLKRVITYINMCFKNHDICIKSRPLRIEGNENNIRAFFLFYINERYIDDAINLPVSIRSFAEELSDHYLRKFPEIAQSYSSSRRLKHYVSVALLRETKAKNSSSETLVSPELLELVQQDIESYKNSTLFRQVFKIELNETVYTRIFSYYLNDYRAFSIRDLNERVLKRPENNELYKKIGLVIDRISTAFGIPVPNRVFLYYKLYNLLIISKRISITPYVIYPNRKIFLLFNKAIPRDILEKARKMYASVLDSVVDRNEAYFYEFIYILVTHWEGFYTAVSEKFKPCRISLFFNSDVEHMRYMKEDLLFQLGNKATVDILTVARLNDLKEASASYDMLIVNFLIPKTLEISTRVISVTDALWTDKLQQIQNVVNETYYNN